MRTITKHDNVQANSRSLSNIVCLKSDNDVCACASSALILLPVVNLSLEMDSASSISFYDVESLTVRRCLSSVLAIFQCACAVSTILLLPVQILASYLNSAHQFSYKDAVILARDTVLATFVTIMFAHAQ